MTENGRGYKLYGYRFRKKKIRYPAARKIVQRTTLPQARPRRLAAGEV